LKGGRRRRGKGYLGVNIIVDAVAGKVVGCTAVLVVCVCLALAEAGGEHREDFLVVAGGWR
jgi:hypothetical protein